MPITATFSADFSSFQTAVSKAETSLRSFETGAHKVQGSLNRMVDSFSGRKLISDATLMAEAVERTGGSARLTDVEFARLQATVGAAKDKMVAMGQDVPPHFDKILAETR